MPTINRKAVKTVSTQTEIRKLRQKMYNTTQWRNLRKIYLMEHPLCEECLKHNIVNAENLSVHHLKSPFDPNISEMERYSRLLDYGNLQTLCRECHGLEHANRQKLPNI